MKKSEQLVSVTINEVKELKKKYDNLREYL